MFPPVFDPLTLYGPITVCVIACTLTISTMIMVTVANLVSVATIKVLRRPVLLVNKCCTRLLLSLLWFRLTATLSQILCLSFHQSGRHQSHTTSSTSGASEN